MKADLVISEFCSTLTLKAFLPGNVLSRSLVENQSVKMKTEKLPTLLNLHLNTI